MAKSKRKIKDKYKQDRDYVSIPYPRNQFQSDYLSLLEDDTKQLVCIDALAGTGKSYIVGMWAGYMLHKGYENKLVVARPYVQTGKSMGSVPGESLPKLYPYVRNVLDNVKKQIGNNVYENYLKDGQTGKIEVQPVESIRGRSFDSGIVILDEAQQATPEEMKAIITRIGQDAKLVVIGDTTQKDLRQQSGLDWLSKFIDKHLATIPEASAIACHEPEYIVRSGLVKNILIALQEDKQ